MKKIDFKIGQTFYTETSKWRCTDIGSRVIIAIELNQENSQDYSGPPYSSAEYIFNEDKIEDCSLDPDEFTQDTENIDEIIKSQLFDDIYNGFMFANIGGCGENSAILNKQTGKIYYCSDLSGIDEFDEISEEDYDPNIHIEIPHKNELDLGRNLVFEFVEQFMPEEADKVGQIFRKRGAYSRYKDLLDSKEMLPKWYDFENRREQLELIEWCKENEIDFKDSVQK